MARATDQECIRAGILRAGVGSASSETPSSIAAYEQAWDRYHRTAGFGDVDPPEVINLGGTEVMLSSPFAPYGQAAEAAPAPVPAPPPPPKPVTPWILIGAAGVALAIYLAMGDADDGEFSEWDEDDLEDEDEDED